MRRILPSTIVVEPPAIRDEIQTTARPWTDHAKINQLHLDVGKMVLRRLCHVENDLFHAEALAIRKISTDDARPFNGISL